MAEALVISLWTYPLKSGAARTVSALTLGTEGLVADRILMAIDETGRQITARECPALLSIEVEEQDRQLALVTAGARPLPLPLPLAAGDGLAGVTLFGEAVGTLGFGADADDWLSLQLGRKARLVRVDPRTLPQDSEGGRRGLADAAQLHLLNQGSLDDLNRRLLWPVPAGRLRPNILLGGFPAFAEDDWAVIRIGAMTLRITESCGRCVLTTIHRDPGQADAAGEPLRTLSSYRLADGTVDFGIYGTAAGESGTIRLGDPVEIVEKRQGKRYPVQLPERPGPGPRILRLVDRQPAGPRGAHLWFAADDGGGLPDCAPGQFLTLTLPHPKGPLRRNYTVSGRTKTRLRLSIRREGVGSTWLCNDLPLGFSLRAQGGHGDVTLPKGPVTLVTAGSGITVALAMVGATAPGQPLRLVHSERDLGDTMGLDELQSRAAADPAMRLELIETAARGRIAAADLAGIGSGATVVLCGPPEFCTAVEALLPRDCRVLTEVFAPSPPPSDAVAEVHSLTLDGLGFSGRSDQTILQAAREANVPIASACEAGACLTCRCRLVSGRVSELRRPASLLEGEILACVTLPLGPVSLQSIA